jgi:hypothetical protein
LSNFSLFLGKILPIFYIKKIEKKNHNTQIYTLKKNSKKLPNFFVKKMAKFHQKRKKA